MDEKASRVYGKITDEGLEELRSRIGVEIPYTQPHIEEVNSDAIRHFVEGIGDRNPVWEQQGIAPPCILFATSKIVGGYVGGLPGVHSLYGGTDWRWYTPVRERTKINTSSHLKSVEEKESRFAGRMVNQVYHTAFKDNNDEVLARADSWCLRTERDTAQKVGKYKDTRLDVYDEEKLREIWEYYENEKIRGEETLYWEDVEEGDEIPTIVKGPLTISGIIKWIQGFGGLWIKAHGFAYEMYSKHPALAIPNSQGVPDTPERVHWDEQMAKEVGAPGIFDYGPERVTWLGNLVTNWKGNEGFLRRLYVEVRRFNLIGDTTWCKGKVSKKYEESGEEAAEKIVECEIWAENQRNEITAKGKAEIVLPVRKK